MIGHDRPAPWCLRRPAAFLLAAATFAAGCDGDAGTPTGTDGPGSPPDPAQVVVARHLDLSLALPPDHTPDAWPLHWDDVALAMDNTPEWNPTTDQGATLGRVLFYDVELSFNRTTSCATCHVQALGFTDPDRFSRGAEGGRTAARSMRLGNAGFYFGRDVFWDRRGGSLEEQVLLPVADPTEMGFTEERGGIPAMIERLESLEYYPILFDWVFGSPEITPERIEIAVAQFVRSLVSADSEFDRAYANARKVLGPDEPVLDLPELSQEESLGFQMFSRSIEAGGAGCAECHLLPTFVLHSNSGNNGLDPDEVRVFKAPSLKNVAVTGPYMHDGRFETLEQVVEHYSSGVRDNPAVDRRLVQAAAANEGARLTPLQRDALVAFLHTLTDPELLTADRFSDPFVR